MSCCSEMKYVARAPTPAQCQRRSNAGEKYEALKFQISNHTSSVQSRNGQDTEMATATIAPDQNAVIAEIFIAAPPARVFQAISDPTQLPRWWGQEGLYRVTKSTMDLRPGGKWRSDGMGTDGNAFYVEGEYLEVDPPRLLVHTWVGSYDPTKTVVRWELAPQTVNALHPGG